MNLAQSRLRNQFIDGQGSKDPVEVVRALCAVQAQDYYASLWAIGLRLKSGRELDVERAIEQRRIVRTWPMRGTLHYVAAEDVRWLLDLLTPRVLRLSAARLKREFGIDAQLMKRAAKVVERAFENAQTLTRPHLYEQLDNNGIATGEQRGMHILWWLAHEGLICCGPRSGKQQTFALLDDWIPQSKPVSRDDALGMLAERYFAHHGPASIADFIWWAGITVAEAKAAIASAGSKLVREKYDEVDWYWISQRRPRGQMSSCHLLPVYDEYTVGYADRSAALDSRDATHAAAGYGIFRAPVLIEGKIVGSWTRQLKKDSTEIRITPLKRFTRAQMQAIEAAAEKYGEFLGLRAKVVLATSE